MEDKEVDAMNTEVLLNCARSCYLPKAVSLCLALVVKRDERALAVKDTESFSKQRLAP